MLFPIARRFFYRVADACKIVAIRTTSAPTRQDVIPRRPGRTRDHKESAQIGEKNAGDLSEGTSGGATLLRVPRSEQERAAGRGVYRLRLLESRALYVAADPRRRA
jgi:hypothetical protein